MSDSLRTVSIAEVADINPVTSLPATGCVSFVGMEDVSESFHLIRSSDRSVTQSSGYSKFQDGDILFAKITPCMENGKGAIVRTLTNGRGFGSTEFHVLRAKQIDPEFLSQWLQSRYLRRNAEAQMTGSAGQRRVPTGFFARFQIPILPLAEQRKIAEILESLDNQIRITEEIISKLQITKQGILPALLSQIKSESIPLGDCLERIDAGWSPDCPDSPPAEGEWGVLKVSAVSSGVYKPGESKRLPGSFPPRPRLEVAENARLMLSDKTLRLVPAPGVDHYFLSEVLKSREARLQIEAMMGGSSSQKNISQAQLRTIRLPLPDGDQQKYFAAVLRSADVRIRQEDTELQKLRSLKQGLMEDLLTGRVRVPVEPSL
jgi:type I restriction enzyme S subunit